MRFLECQLNDGLEHLQFAEMTQKIPIVVF